MAAILEARTRLYGIEEIETYLAGIDLKLEIVEGPSVVKVPSRFGNLVESKTLFISDKKDMIIASCTALIYIKNGDRYMRIGHLEVIEEKQHKGFGTLLLQVLAYKAKEGKCSHIELLADDKAIPFYKKIGFYNIDDVYDRFGLRTDQNSICIHCHINGGVSLHLRIL